MKTLNQILFGLILLVFASSCIDAIEDIEDVEPPEDILCEEIGGDYSEDLILINRIADPSVADYCVTETINMMEGAGFIVEPGVVIEFEPGTHIQLGKFSDGGLSSGFIKAEGTTDQAIVFRGTEDTPGIWGGILIGCNSNDVRNILQHCTIEYAGNASNGYGIGIALCSNGASGLLSVANTTVKHSLGAGLLARGENAINQFSTNIFEDNSEEAILIHAQDFSDIGSETIFNNNGINGVVGVEGVYKGRIRDDQHHTWHQLNNGAYYLNSRTYLNNGSLTIEPGTEIVVGNGIQLALEGSSFISAIGTASEPIIFRGLNPGTASWNAIYLSAHHTPNVLEYCHISEAGVGTIRNNSCHGEAAIGLDYWFGNGAIANIKNCTISNSAHCGIFTDLDNLDNLTHSDNAFLGNVNDDICH